MQIIYILWSSEFNTNNMWEHMESLYLNNWKNKVKWTIIWFSEITGERVLENREIELNHFGNSFMNISFLKLGIRMGVDIQNKKYKKAYREV